MHLLRWGPRLTALTLLAACNSLSGLADLSITKPTDAGSESKDGGEPPVGDEPLPNGGGAGDAGEASPLGTVFLDAPEGLDFGSIDCGDSAPAARHARIHNSGADDVEFDAAMSQPAPFAVTPATGTVPRGGFIDLTISAAAVAKDAIPATTTNQLVVITTAPGDVRHALDVTLTVSGAVFKIAPEGPFQFKGGASDTQTFTIRNDGNITGTITLSLTQIPSDAIALSPITPAVIAPGKSDVRTLLFDRVNNKNPIVTGQLSFSTTTPLCAALPAALALVAQPPP
jgi:hypothetical protein